MRFRKDKNKPEIISYVVGYLFSEDTLQVLLIRKNRPTWQAGRLNGVGGHIEPGESPEEAMCREFKEETGERYYRWKHTITLLGPTFKVYYFRGRSDAVIEKIMGRETYPTDELPELHGVGAIPQEELVRSCVWTIPLSNDESGVVFPVKVNDAMLPGDGY
jgi:8-oxo-dGTP diphosphatase